MRCRLRVLLMGAVASLALCGSAQAEIPSGSVFVGAGGEQPGLFSIDSVSNQVTGSPISLAASPTVMAITPDGSRLYTVNGQQEAVEVIDTRTRQPIGAPIPVGEEPEGIAIKPDGTRAFVTNELSSSVSVIDTRSNQVVATFPVETEPEGIAITPDGSRFLVTSDSPNDSVTQYSTATGLPLAPPIVVGPGPHDIAITPDGTRAFVASDESTDLAVIDIPGNRLAAPLVALPAGGDDPEYVTISPDGTRAYLVGFNETVTVVDTRTLQVSSLPTPGALTGQVSFAPNGDRAYATDFVSGEVIVLDTATGAKLAGVPVGNEPFAIAFSPDQGPVAGFAPPARARPGVPVTLDATASKDPDGAIATYAWTFGDGGAASVATPTTSQTFAKPGTYPAVVTVTDRQGCSATVVFTGHTVSCNGSAAATTSRSVVVAYPGVQVACPKSAKPKGCAFKLQVVAKKPKRGKKAKFQSALAKVKVKAGKSAIVSLRAKAPFAAKLAGASSVLVKETKTVGGKRTTGFRKVKIVQ